MMPATLVEAIIFLAVTCLVFGVAGLAAAKAPGAPVLSLRRSHALDRVVPSHVGERLMPEEGAARNHLRLYLLQAGFDSPRAAQTYYGIRIGLMILPPLILFAAFFFMLEPRITYAICAAAALLGYLGPAFAVRIRRSRRQRHAREGFPDMLDLFLVCTEAGLGIDTAIARVGEELVLSRPLLSEHLAQVGMELYAGRPRAEAMRALAERTGIDEAISLVNLLVQSDTLGTSMSATLRVFADDMRAKRLLKAEEMGHKVSVKLTVVLVSCFLPAIILAIMTPIVFKTIDTFRNLAGASWGGP